MDAIIYTMDGQEYEMLSGILEEESPGLAVSRGVIDGEYHLEPEYDVVVVGINGAQGMELVCKYRELYGNTLVIWITDDPYFARVAIRTHSFDFIVRPFQGTRFREAIRRIKEGDIAVWQRIPVESPVYQRGCNCKKAGKPASDVLDRRKIPLPLQGQEHFSFGKTRRKIPLLPQGQEHFSFGKTRRKIPLLPQGQEHFSFGKTRRNGTIWKRIKDYFLSENTL